MRKIDEIIIHCTATEAGKDITAQEIDNWHTSRGWSGIGYHYVIRLNGKVEEGRPIGIQGAHCQGHNAYSIGIAYVGGLLQGKPADTRTQEQIAALDKLIIELAGKYDIKKVTGHNEYSNKECPCFNVREYMKRFCGNCLFKGQDCVYCKTCRLSFAQS